MWATIAISSKDIPTVTKLYELLGVKDGPEGENHFSKTSQLWRQIYVCKNNTPGYKLTSWRRSKPDLRQMARAFLDVDDNRAKFWPQHNSMFPAGAQDYDAGWDE